MAHKATETNVQIETQEVISDIAVETTDVKGKKRKKSEKPLSPAKQAKLEKKARKKEIKALRKEAKLHSLKFERRKIFGTRVLAVLLIIAMLTVSGVILFTYNQVKKETDAANQTVNSSDSGDSVGTPVSTGSTSSTSADPSPAVTNDGGSFSVNDSNTSANTDEQANASAGAKEDLSTPAGIVAFYKTAHANTLAQAKEVKQVYSNASNYNSVLEIGDNSTLSGIAQKLMSQFLKEDTKELVYSGSEMKDKFPGKNAANLTADMVKDATCKDNGDTYTIVLKSNSTEDKYDLGEKASCFVPVVNESDITGAVKGLITFTGVENRYIGSTITATVDKATKRITHIETDSPSYMFFGQVKAIVIKVDNCRIGLEYFTKWDVNY